MSPLVVAHGILQGVLAGIVPLLPVLVALRGGGESLATLATWSVIAYGVGVGASAVAAPVWGAMSDRFGTRAMLFRAMAGLALSLLLLAWAPNPAWIVAARLVQGLLSGVEAALYAYAVALIPQRHDHGPLFAKLEAAAATAGFVGPWAAALGMALLGPTGLCLAATAIVALTALGAAMVLAKPIGSGSVQTSPGSFGITLGALVRPPPGAERPLFLLFVVGAVDAFVERLYPLLVVTWLPDNASAQALWIAAIDSTGEAAYLLAALLLARQAMALSPNSSPLRERSGGEVSETSPGSFGTTLSLKGEGTTPLISPSPFRERGPGGEVRNSGAEVSDLQDEPMDLDEDLPTAVLSPTMVQYALLLSAPCVAAVAVLTWMVGVVPPGGAAPLSVLVAFVLLGATQDALSVAIVPGLRVALGRLPHAAGTALGQGHALLRGGAALGGLAAIPLLSVLGFGGALVAAAGALGLISRFNLTGKLDLSK